MTCKTGKQQNLLGYGYLPGYRYLLEYKCLLTIIVVILGPFFTVANAVGESGVTDEFSPAINKSALIHRVLAQSGLLTVLNETNAIRDEELVKLSASQGPITPQELDAVKTRLNNTVRESQFLEQIHDHLANQFSVKALEQIIVQLETPAIEKAKQIQDGVAESDFKERIRHYHLKLKEQPPRQSRIDLIRELAEAERLNDINAMVKVEVRKSLLTAITHVKNNLIPTENELELQMKNFRQRVNGQLSDERIEHYLYLFRSTPSSEIKKIIAEYQRPDLQSMVDSCEQLIKEQFSIGRQENKLQDESSQSNVTDVQSTLS